MGFGEKWIAWIETCISIASILILVNGTFTQQFQMKKCLHQECPLSPFLFNMVVETFSLLMHKAETDGILKGVDNGKRRLPITHLQYVYDVIILCKPTFNNLLNTKRILRCFQVVSRPRINFQKSLLLCVGLEQYIIEELAERITCKVGKLLTTYLSLGLKGVVN